MFSLATSWHSCVSVLCVCCLIFWEFDANYSLHGTAILINKPTWLARFMYPSCLESQYLKASPPLYHLDLFSVDYIDVRNWSQRSATLVDLCFWCQYIQLQAMFLSHLTLIILSQLKHISGMLFCGWSSTTSLLMDIIVLRAMIIMTSADLLPLDMNFFH